MNQQLAERYEILKSILNENKLDALSYLNGVFEEYKYKVDDDDKFSLLKKIIDLQNSTIQFDNYEKYINYALKIGLKLHQFKDVIEIYKKYCKYLYKTAKYKKCSLLIDNVLKNFEKYLKENDTITFQELNILSKNGTQIKMNNSIRSKIKSLMIKEKDMYQLVETFISYNSTNLHNFHLEELLNNYSFLLDYLKENNFCLLTNPQLASYLNDFTGRIYFYNGYYKHAKRHFFVALQDEIPLRNITEIVNYNNNIATTYFHLGYLNKVENYFKIIESMLPKVDNQKTINYAYSNLALTYVKKGKISLAKAIYKKTLLFMKEVKNLHGILYYTSNIINMLLLLEPSYVKKQFVIFKATNNQISNHFYDIYETIYNKLILKKGKLINSLNLIAQSEYYPLSFLPMLSMLLKAYPILRKNMLFKKIINHMMRIQKVELTSKHFHQHYKTFSEYDNLFYIFENTTEERYNHYDVMHVEEHLKYPLRLKFKHLQCSFAKHYSKNEIVNIHLKNIDFENMKISDYLLLIYIKMTLRGTIRISNRYYKYDCFNNNQKGFFEQSKVKEISIKRIH